MNENIKVWAIRIGVGLAMSYIGIDNVHLNKNVEHYRINDKITEDYIDDLKRQRDKLEANCSLHIE